MGGRIAAVGYFRECLLGGLAIDAEGWEAGGASEPKVGAAPHSFLPIPVTFAPCLFTFIAFLLIPSRNSPSPG